MFTTEIFLWIVGGVAAATILSYFSCAPVTKPLLHAQQHCIPLPSGYTNNLTLTTVTSFLVGLFANTLLQRWWALRMHLLGHMGGNNEVIILTATTLANSKLINENPEYTAEAKQACYSIYRYLNLGNYLTIFNASKEFKYDLLLKKGILTKSEYEMVKSSSGSPNIAYSWIDSRLQKLANAGFLGAFPGPGHSNLSALLTAVGNSRANCIAVMTYVDTQLPYPFVQLVAFVVNACLIQVVFVSGGTIGQGRHINDYSLVFTGYLTTILFIAVMRSLLLLYNILCNPLGDDAADFPSTSYLNAAEKGMLGLMNNVFSISLTTAEDSKVASYKVDEDSSTNRTRLHFAPDSKFEPLLQLPGYHGGNVNLGSYYRQPQSGDDDTSTVKSATMDMTADFSSPSKSPPSKKGGWIEAKAR